MSTLTAPGNPGGSNSRAGGRKHAIASVAGGTALVAVVLGAAACAAPPAGGSRPVSLSGPSGAAAPSVLVPGTPAAVTSVPGAPKARAVPPAGAAPGGAGHPGQSPERTVRASRGTRYRASGLPQPVTGSQPRPAW